ncbi:DNA-directed RNA polymerase subunit beta [Candidatus Dojkabacteria bacterium]|uniref:DNA-directed RNA polymerase subunit beta n=1 Tax=Candidatus Dojkabacteria bacterium TaxID=2099670 RepID=A0A955L8S3_9BACT|nr:DNA-directed RNA polymerase subunit beta [Candidatus Dojkabacteria bacterium]
MAATSDRISLAKFEYPTLTPNLIEAQINSFNLFVEEGVKEVFEEINPIQDYTGEAWELQFEGVEWGKPNHSFRKSMELGLSYDRPLYISASLNNRKTGQTKKQRLFVTDVPIMSERGTFVISGNERVVVMQIARAEGILFYETKTSTSQRRLYGVKLMPTRGRWFDFETNKYGVMSVKLLDKRPKILLTTLLRALGYSSDDNLRRLLEEHDTSDLGLLENTLKRDATKNRDEALLDIYRKLRPEDSISLESAEAFLNSLFFDKRRFYLGRIGRYQLNKKLGVEKEITAENYVLFKEDLVSVVQSLLQLNSGTIPVDDIDNLANRRIRGVGELIADQMRIGALRMEKNIRDRMGTYGTDELITPSVLVNTRPVIASVSQFFGSSQVSRYMDQENILSEIETKRRITAGGPGGLTKERATFSVRDVHSSSYSRICPVTTPEGPSIGIVSHMSMYARINSYGFLEAPYYRVVANIDLTTMEDTSVLVGHTLRSDAKDADGKVVVSKGTKLTKSDLSAIEKAEITKLQFEPVITDEVVYLAPDDEANYSIAGATVRDEDMNFITDTVFVRSEGSYKKVPINEVDFIDINPGQIAGLGFSLVPFAAHDDPTRTLMASNMQRQAVPLLRPTSPIVGTGYEKIVADASKRSVRAEQDGEVIESDADGISVKYKDGSIQEYETDIFVRTNQNTTFTQKVLARKGDKLKKGDLLIDGPSMQEGELALGRNLTAAYMIYEGYNYEDAIIVSERLVKEDVLTSIHIKEYSQEIRDTKLGKELVTADIPNIGEYLLRNLDEDGIVRVGASVESKDILVGIVAPKGEVELTAEEKLLRAIFGEYARDVRDNSLRLPHGDSGIVIGVQVLDKEKGDKLNPGVLKQVKVWVARTKKIQVGDKLTGIHGDKGVISKILPEADMPYMEDGTPIDIILSPMFVKRMNVGQIKEMHVAAQAEKLGKKVTVPPFTPIDDEMLVEELKKQGIDWAEKITLYDGRTGLPFDKKVTVGPRYIVKLNHLSSDKIHARSTGPYTVVTQQPLGGKAQFGGQRFGEMEVWALEAHAVPNVLQEMLTIKSDDVVGRAAAYKSIIQGMPIDPPSTPESFRVFKSELQALGVKLSEIEEDIDPIEDAMEEEGVDVLPEGGDPDSGSPDEADSTVMGDEEGEELTDVEVSGVENDPNFEVTEGTEE